MPEPRTFEQITAGTKLDIPLPRCPHCGAAVAWHRTERGFAGPAYEWSCGTWANGAGAIRTSRCRRRAMWPWNRGGGPVVFR